MIRVGEETSFTFQGLYSLQHFFGLVQTSCSKNVEHITLVVLQLPLVEQQSKCLYLGSLGNLKEKNSGSGQKRKIKK